VEELKRVAAVLELALRHYHEYYDEWRGDEEPAEK
jgi:hypothetical protein